MFIIEMVIAVFILYLGIKYKNYLVRGADPCAVRPDALF